MQYEWDLRKAEVNQKKHGVSFVEATTVFLDPLALTFDDPDHSTIERRYITVGASIGGRVLLVSIAERDDRVRIISARCATRKEIRGYEEGEF